MNPVWIITGKEVRDSLRNRWVLAATVLLAALALSLGFLGSTPTGSVKVDPLTVTVVSLSSLSIFLIPLIAMLLSYDALIGEIERGTMALLLSYPVSRVQILAGKFIGHIIILTLATAAGYGLAGRSRRGVSGDGLCYQCQGQRTRHGGGCRYRRMAVFRGDFRYDLAGRFGGR